MDSPPVDLPSAGADGAPGPVCHCGHAKVAHEHYRRGSDCSLCGCRRFRRVRRPWWRIPRP